jgi:hypothetical protein
MEKYIHRLVTQQQSATGQLAAHNPKTLSQCAATDPIDGGPYSRCVVFESERIWYVAIFRKDNSFLM